MTGRMHDQSRREDDLRPIPARPPEAARGRGARAEGAVRGGVASGQNLGDVSVLPHSPEGSEWQQETQSFGLSVQVAEAQRGPGAPGQGRTFSARRSGWDHDSALADEGEEYLEEEEEGVRVGEPDSVGSKLTYLRSVSEKGAPDPGDFGTTFTSIAMTGITVTHDKTAKKFTVKANVKSTIRWAAKKSDKWDIPNSSAPAITHKNYPDVASDLTPDMKDLNGRPPRTVYWARDLTRRHEKFHANERAETYGLPAFAFARKWLEGQTAGNAADATKLAKKVPDRMHQSYAASYSPKKEHRAYGDGAPAYEARAKAILAKGKKNLYPGAPKPAPKAPKKP